MIKVQVLRGLVLPVLDHVVHILCIQVANNTETNKQFVCAQGSGSKRFAQEDAHLLKFV